MAVGCRFLLSCLWFCLLIFQASNGRKYDLDDNSWLLFAPGLPVVQTPAVFCTWKRESSLRSWTRRRRPAVPNCCWLLLLAGDIKSNPGPLWPTVTDATLNSTDVDSSFVDDWSSPIGLQCCRGYLSCQVLNAHSIVNKRRDLQALA